MPESAPKRRLGWALPGVLIAVYLLLKLQGWFYARSARELEQKLEDLRPSLSAIVLKEQADHTAQAYQQLSQLVRSKDLPMQTLLHKLSDLPASFTVEKLDAHARPYKILLSGKFFPGPRDPEQVMARWAKTLELNGSQLFIRKLSPVSTPDGVWAFEVEILNA